MSAAFQMGLVHHPSIWAAGLKYAYVVYASESLFSSLSTTLLAVFSEDIPLIYAVPAALHLFSRQYQSVIFICQTCT